MVGELEFAEDDILMHPVESVARGVGMQVDVANCMKERDGESFPKVKAYRLNCI